MVLTTKGFFEVAIESWPEWDLNPRPLNSGYIYKVKKIMIIRHNSYEINKKVTKTYTSYNYLISQSHGRIKEVPLRNLLWIRCTWIR